MIGFLLQAGNRTVIEAGDDSAGVDGEPVEGEPGIELLFPNHLAVFETDGSDEAVVLLLIEEGAALDQEVITDHERSRLVDPWGTRKILLLPGVSE